MREHTKQLYRTCTRLFGKQNPLNLMMFGCWGIVVVGHNLLSLMKEFKKNLILPRPYVGSYIGEKGHQFLQQPWIIALYKSVETFIMISISDMTTSQYSEVWEVLWIKQKSY